MNDGTKVRMKNGMPGEYVVVRRLTNNRVRVRKFPIRAGDLELEIYLADVETVIEEARQ
jgi:hypothetical protein